MKDDDYCYQPGWDNGPVTQGGEPSSQECESGANHEDDHYWYDWDNEGKKITWPISWVMTEEEWEASFGDES